MKRAVTLLTALAAVLAVCGPARPAEGGVIVLEDGSHLSGRIAAAPADGPVEIRLPGGEVRTVERDGIAHLVKTPVDDPEVVPDLGPELAEVLRGVLAEEWSRVQTIRQEAMRAGARENAQAEFEAAETLRGFADRIERYPPLALEILADARHGYLEARRRAGAAALDGLILDVTNPTPDPGDPAVVNFRDRHEELSDRLEELREDDRIHRVRELREGLASDADDLVSEVATVLEELRSTAALCGETEDIPARQRGEYLQTRNRLVELREEAETLAEAAPDVEPGLAEEAREVLDLTLRVPEGWQYANPRGVHVFRQSRADEDYRHRFSIAKAASAGGRERVPQIGRLRTSARDVLEKARRYDITNDREETAVAGAEAFRIEGRVTIEGEDWVHFQVVFRVEEGEGEDATSRAYILNFFHRPGTAGEAYKSLYEEVLESIRLQEE